MRKRAVYQGIFYIGIAVLLCTWMPKIFGGKSAAADLTIGKSDIGGVVKSSKGPEAGVWVIAETKDFPSKFVKIVVTDDYGRYLIPELPKANYSVWVRGYGLVDSSPIAAQPGKNLDLTAKLAPDARAAAQYYPSDYWYSLLKVPAKSDFPGTGPSGNGISPRMKSQEEWVEWVKTDGCEVCHQIGDKATREIPASFGHFDSSVAAWNRRISSAQVGRTMNGAMQRFGAMRGFAMFADWTDRIAAGEYPKDAPARPQGIERNVVITEWDWGTPKEYFHDMISTDRRNPSVNANGPIYGSHEVSTDFISVLDPVHNTKEDMSVPIIDPKTPFAEAQDMSEPSPYWGDEMTWTSKADIHSMAIDAKGRLWATATTRASFPVPSFCGAGANNPSALAFPIVRTGAETLADRQATVYDPETRKFTNVNLCFHTQHLNFAEVADNTLWFSAPGKDVIGWLNTKMFDETHDAEKSQGWTALVIDTNGNGKRDAYVEPDQPVDPTKDKRIKAGFYAVNPSPADGSVWGTLVENFPGGILRLNPGSNPASTALAEFYAPPLKDPNNPSGGYQAFSPRGMDIDRNGVVWTVMASGPYASFDRRKCKGPLNGPKAATGQLCPEGWTIYRVPGPSFAGTEYAADSSYYNWVDQFDTFGLGKNVPIATGNGSDSLLALSPDTGKFVTLRVPYPMGFYAKNMDGRVDDPKTGWKGKALWSTFASRTPQHFEGGKGTTSKVVKFQLRPDPLA